MAKKIFSGFQDFVGSELRNFIVEDVTAATATKGFVVDRTAKKIRFWDGVTSVKALDEADLDTDVTLAADSDLKIATQKAVKAYVDTLGGALAGGIRIKGTFVVTGVAEYPKILAANAVNATQTGDGSGTSPASIKQGDAWFVSTTGGTVGGQTVEVGDMIVAVTDLAVDSNSDADWTVLQNNTVAASTTIAGVVELATTAETNAKTDTTRAVTPASLADFGKVYSETIVSANVQLTNTITHSLGRLYPGVAVYGVTSGLIDVTVTPVSTTATDVTFSSLPGEDIIFVFIG